jgi:hypothetical protein
MSHETEAQSNNEVMLALVQTIQKDVSDMQATLKAHIDTEPKEWAKVLSDLMIKSFPDGDPDGHRRDHETRMKLAEEKAAFWAKMTYELKKWGLLGFILWSLKTLIEAGALWVTTGGHIK